MVKVICNTVDMNGLAEVAREIGGFYIKVVVDLEKEVMAAGAKMHVAEEQMLIAQEGKNENLWGVGYDLELREVTFDSIINNKPGVNTSSDILDSGIRKKFETIVRRLLSG